MVMASQQVASLSASSSKNDKDKRSPNKAERARIAKETINVLVPKILTSFPRAKAGIESVEKFRSADIPHAPTVETASRTRPKVHIIQSDTFDAAHSVVLQYPKAKVAILNMCSTMQPGGGVLRGAKAQEETLCIRSTLYPSLHDNFYRMQEDALIYTPDVLVFRKSDMEMLLKTDSFYVDVISCPALRKPQVEKGEYIRDRDTDIMTEKMKMIMRIAVEKKIEYLILGALGCGAYGNPSLRVAELFKRVIYGNPKRREMEHWESVKEIWFAIYGEDDNFPTFKKVFDESERSLQDEARGNIDEGH